MTRTIPETLKWLTSKVRMPHWRSLGDGGSGPVTLWVLPFSHRVLEVVSNGNPAEAQGRRNCPRTTVLVPNI